MQVYRGMDIGTAKLPESKRKVPHFGLDLVEPSHSYSAAEYQSYARNIIESETGQDISSPVYGLPPIVCGGTGLYLRAALDDFDFAGLDEEATQKQLEARKRYEQLHEEIGTDELHKLLSNRDPAAAEEVHPNNVRRVIRALELWEAGQSYANIKQAFKARNSYYPTIWIGLTCQREVLYQRIEQRVDTMMEQGLLGEVDALLQKGYRDALTAAQAIGYKELVPVLEGNADLEEAVLAIKQATRRYAKRQLSWFRSDLRIIWIERDDMTATDVVQEIANLDEFTERYFD